MIQNEKDKSGIKEVYIGMPSLSIELDFLDIKEYCFYQKSSLLTIQNNFKNNVLEKTKGMNEKQKSMYYEYLADERWKLHNVFPLLQWNTIFVTSCSLFEYHLQQIQNFVINHTENQTINEEASDFLSQFKKFISNKFQLNIFNNKIWSDIKDFKKIRNFIVHNANEIKLCDNDSSTMQNVKKRLLYDLQRKDLIEIIENNTFGIITLKSFEVENAINTFENFLLGSCKEIGEKLDLEL